MNVDAPYEVLICGGPSGIAGRVVGGQVRRLTKRERTALKRLLAEGYTIQVLAPDETTWNQIIKPSLYHQLGLSS